MKKQVMQHRYITIGGELKKFPVYSNETAGAVKQDLCNAFNLPATAHYELQDSAGNRIKGHLILNDISGPLALVEKQQNSGAGQEWSENDNHTLPNAILR